MLISWNPNGLLQRCIRELKKAVPEILVITDVAMDPYSSAGHDGYVDHEGRIDNDITLPILCKMAVAQAEAGADVVSPTHITRDLLRTISFHLRIIYCNVVKNVRLPLRI